MEPDVLIDSNDFVTSGARDDTLTRAEVAAAVARFNHELRAPLQAILSHAGLLRLGLAISDNRRESIDAIHTAVREMADLLDDLGLFARGEAPAAPQRQVVNLASLGTEIVNQLRPAAEANGVRVTVEGPSLFVLTDKRRLRQVLLNLTSNAIKYNRVDGWVRISFKTDRSRTRVEVMDSGVGIPPAFGDRVFQPFVRVNPDIPGAGLGLAIAKEIVEALGGRIGLHSGTESGTTVWFDLPTWTAKTNHKVHERNGSAPDPGLPRP